jgi:hypothetical protein
MNTLFFRQISKIFRLVLWAKAQIGPATCRPWRYNYKILKKILRNKIKKRKITSHFTIKHNFPTARSLALAVLINVAQKILYSHNAKKFPLQACICKNLNKTCYSLLSKYFSKSMCIDMFNVYICSFNNNYFGLNGLVYIF